MIISLSDAKRYTPWILSQKLQKMFETYSIVYMKIIYISDKGSGNLIGRISIIYREKKVRFHPRNTKYCFDAQAQKHV